RLLPALFALLLACQGARAELVPFGLDWRRNVFVQEYWEKQTPYYMIANLRNRPAMIVVREWARKQRKLPLLAGPWEVPANSVRKFSAVKLKQSWTLKWELQDGIELGITRPPGLPPPKSLTGLISSHAGLNSSGVSAFWCAQKKPVYKAGETIEVQLPVSRSKGKFVFKSQGSETETDDRLTETFVKRVVCPTLPV